MARASAATARLAIFQRSLDPLIHVVNYTNFVQVTHEGLVLLRGVIAASWLTGSKELWESDHYHVRVAPERVLLSDAVQHLLRGDLLA
jgi:hypothetical protein